MYRDMNREVILADLNDVFRDLFDDQSISLNDGTTAADVDGWDSLEHINLILAVEEKFNMKFTMGEVTGMKNIGEMIDIIIKKRRI